MDINSTQPVFQGSPRTHKEYTDTLFKAWCAVTVLPPERARFEGIVSSLIETGKKAFTERGMPADYPSICSTAGVLVVTHKRAEPSGRDYFQHEVCITICYRYEEGR